MDVIRACYRKWVWFDNARTLGAYVQWYWAPDEATFLDENVFSSETWDQVHWWGPGAGEAWDTPRTYVKGELPGPFTGTGGVCGQLAWFSDGCPSDAPPLPRTGGGLPACCFGPGLTGGYDLGYSRGWNRLRVIGT